jgi:hypothetical protein
VPIRDAIECAVGRVPIRDLGDCNRIEQMQADSLESLLAELKRLETLLRDAEPQCFKPVPEPELRMRAPL